MLKPPIPFTMPFSIRVHKPFAVTHYEVRDAHGAYLFELHDARLADFVVKSCNTAATVYSVECRAGNGWERIEADQGDEQINYPSLEDAHAALGSHMAALNDAGLYFDSAEDFRIVPVPGVYHQYLDLVRPT